MNRRIPGLKPGGAMIAPFRPTGGKHRRSEDPQPVHHPENFIAGMLAAPAGVSGVIIPFNLGAVAFRGQGHDVTFE